MNNNSKRIVAGILYSVGVVLLSAAHASAAVALTTYNLSGYVGTEASAPADTSAANVTGSTMVRGSGLGGTSGGNSINTTGWNDGSAQDYISFGFTVAPGYSASLNELLFATRSSGTGPGTMGVYASVDGGAEILLYSILQAPGANYVNNDINLGSPLLVNQSLTVYLRKIGTTAANGGAIGSSGTFRISEFSPDGQTFTDVSLFGTVAAVPEAQGWVTMTCLIMGAGFWISRRSKTVAA